MARDPSEPPSGKPAEPSRQQRLAAALRENLKRRKAQRRARNRSEGIGAAAQPEEERRH